MTMLAAIHNGKLIDARSETFDRRGKATKAAEHDLKKMAKSRGYDLAEVEIVEKTDAELAALIETRNVEQGVVPPRNVFAELDALAARVKALEGR